jgi:hypothetical protein
MITRKSLTHVTTRVSGRIALKASKLVLTTMGLGLTAFLAIAVAAQGRGPSIHQPDTAPLTDFGRTVSGISRTGFSLQYATSKPCETKVELRQGDALAVLSPGAAPNYRVVSSPAAGLWHRVQVTGLKPGKRYYYRLYDPGATPSLTEVEWGAGAPWSREFAVSTEAPAGRKTIIHLPVKVLLMPNVVNAQSAVQPDGSLAPEPPKIAPEQLSLIENEFRVASRVLWCNSGMRLWVDFKFFVDDRWQRWGPTAPTASPFFQNLPACRTYAGYDFLGPGGGTFTNVDTHDLTKVSGAPVNDGFVCQMEMAWPRRWDPVLRTWRFYVSGGDTSGAEDLPHGIPVRSQFLAGGDTAWLAASEFHRQLEWLGTFSFGIDEDDRIVDDRPLPRHRVRLGNGTYDEVDWNTAGPHGEEWDILRYWERRVTDCQWLRLGFGTTETVADKDGDGFPDNDSALPLDAVRFMKYARTASYTAACLWDWVMLPVQPSWVKDRSGLDSGGVDPELGWLGWSRLLTKESLASAGIQQQKYHYYFAELLGFNAEPILPIGSALQANPEAWHEAGYINRPALNVSFRHGYDEAGYYGLIMAKGNVGHIDVDLDGEGHGMFTPPGALGFSIVSLKPSAGQAGPVVLPVSVRPRFGGVQNRTPWLTWNAVRRPEGVLVFEFKIANGGDGPWFWHGAGHRIGVAINAYDTEGRGYSMGEPYRLNVCRMAEIRGREPRPAAPDPLPTELVPLKPGDKAFTLSPGWSLAGDGSYHHEGDASAIVIGGRKAVDFDLIAEVQATGRYGIGGYAQQPPIAHPDRDYTVMIEDGKATLRANGEASDAQSVSAGPHKLELRRRGGGVWLLIDDKVAGYALDKNPRVVVSRYLIFSGSGGMTLRSVSYREAPAS